MYPSSLVSSVRDFLAAQEAEPSVANVVRALRAAGVAYSDEQLVNLIPALQSELTGAGPVDHLLKTPGVTDVLVNGHDEVWFEKDGRLQRSSVGFVDEESLRQMAVRMATSVGRRLDDSSPWVDARIRSGARVHAIVPPLSRQGTCLSLRMPATTGRTLEELVASGSIAGAAAVWLEALVRARMSFLVSGGTGAGKTTILSAMLSGLEPGERLLIVEDSSELDPAHDHVVKLESRPANVEGRGEIALRVLIRQALRMRPDRIVIGEVRGAEITDLLAALNTGHEGGCGTIHANSAIDVPARVEALALAAGLNREAAHAQLAAGVAAVVHVARDSTGARGIESLHVLERGPAGLAHCSPAVKFANGRSRVSTQGVALARRLGLLTC